MNRATFLLYRSIENARNILNWRIIRSIGELQIFTKASYLMLVLVPVLAATWPAVRLLVNQHNKAVSQATNIMLQSASSLDKAVDEATASIPRLEVTELAEQDDIQVSDEPAFVSELRQETQRFTESVREFASDFERRALETPVLPWSLGAGFFAALFVVAGQLFYQVGAPDTIRSYSWANFVIGKKEDYSKHPSEDALARAQEFLGTKSGQRLREQDRLQAERTLSDLFHYEDNEKKLRQELDSLKPERLSSLHSWVNAGQTEAPLEFRERVNRLILDLRGISSADGSSMQQMTTIERGAKAEYLSDANEKVPMILVTAILYAFGIFLLFAIIRVQAIAVFKAAGWQSITDLFFP